MKATVAAIVIALLLATFAAAHGDETFEAAEGIIMQKIPCSELADGQLEMIGDYYMEQMHPGELHETMDERMGGEGSESLRQAHISMAKSFYCGDETAMQSGMMNMVMGRGGNYGMMGGFGAGGYGMMGYGQNYWGLNSFLLTLLLLLLIALAAIIVMRLLHAKSNGIAGNKKRRKGGDEHGMLRR